MKQILNLCIFIICNFLTNNVAFSQHKTSQGRSSPGTQLLSFEADLHNNKVILQWAIAENEIADRFEVEKSVNGKKFELAALVFTSEKSGEENYMFYENKTNSSKIYYRIKIFDKTKAVNYSKVLILDTRATNNDKEVKYSTTRATVKLVAYRNRLV